MFVIRLANLTVRIENQYDFVRKQCRDYIVPDDSFDFSVRATKEEIEKEMQSEEGTFPPDYCESICLYRHICTQSVFYNVFLMHSAVIVRDGNAYAFTAPSGTGKSTHLALWQKAIPDCRVLNGDKPLYRLDEDGSVTVYGTPWNGKENWGYNGSAKLVGVCFLERGKENTIRTCPKSECVGRLIHQLYLKGERERVKKQLDLMNTFLSSVPFYVLACNISEEAPLLSYHTMKNGIKTELKEGTNHENQ